MVQTTGRVRVGPAIGGCAVGLAVGWNHTDVGAVADTFTEAYGVSLGMVGLFTGVLFIAHAAVQLPAGRAVDAFGARRLALTALTLLVGANALALLAPAPSLALVARALTGLGTGLGFVAGLDYVRTGSRSPLAQGTFGASTLAGAGLGVAVVPLLAEPFGFRAPFIGAIGLASVAALVLWSGRAGQTRARPDQGRRVMVSGGTAGSLVRLCLLSMATFGLTIVVGNWIVTLLERRDGLSAGLAGAIGSAALLGGIVGRPLGGWIARRCPQRNRLTVAVSFAAAAAGTAGLAAQGPLPTVLAAALVLGVAAGVPFAPLFGAAAHARPHSPATAIAVVNLASNLFIVAGIPLLGLAFSLPGDGRAGIWIAAVLWLAAIVVVPGTRELDLEPSRLDQAPIAPDDAVVVSAYARAGAVPQSLHADR